MKVQITITGEHRGERVDWPEGWPVPREGEQVCLPFGYVCVRTVVWYPQGNSEGGGSAEPLVYVVLGPSR